MRLKFLSFSLAVWAAFAAFGISSGHLGLSGWSTDHNSHVDAAVLFCYRGFDIYRKPMNALAARSESALAREYAAKYNWPADSIYDLPERAGRPPLLINGPTIPCPYPPGMLLYSLPEAILKEALGLSPKAVATLSLLKFLIVTHLLIWMFWGLLLEKSDDDARALAVWVILPLVYLESIAWALTGVYDAVALIALLLCVGSLRSKRGLESLLWYALAAFLHFRTLWFLPLFLAGLRLFWKNREYRMSAGRDRLMAVAGAIMLGVSAWCFLTIYPFLAAMGTRNFFFFDGDLPSLARLCYLLVPMALIAAGLARDRAWLMLSCLAWTLVMVCRSPFVQMWHSLYLLPLLAMTGLGEKSAARGRLLALLAYLVMASLAFTRFPFSGVLVLDALKELL